MCVMCDVVMCVQGRVWSGREAIKRGLVDALGGVHAAVQLAKQAAGVCSLFIIDALGSSKLMHWEVIRINFFTSLPVTLLHADELNTDATCALGPVHAINCVAFIQLPTASYPSPTSTKQPTPTGLHSFELVRTTPSPPPSNRMLLYTAGIPEGERVRVIDVGRARTSPLALLQGGAVAAVLASRSAPSSPAALLGMLLAPLLAGSPSSLSAAVPAVEASVGAGSLGGLVGGVFGAQVPAEFAGSLGPTAAAAAAQALSLGSAANPFGVVYAAEPESLVVSACGSTAAVAAAGDAAVSACTGFLDE